MANRSNVTSSFATLPPNWLLATLDADLNALAGTLNDSSLGWVVTGTDTGAANAYNIPTLTFGVPTAYQAGMMVVFTPVNTNTSASTIQIAGLLAVAIQNPDGSALVGGCLIAGRTYVLEYTGTAFRILNPGSSFGQWTSTFSVGGLGAVNTVTPWSTVGTSQGVVGGFAAGTFTTPVGVNCVFQLTATDNSATAHTTYVKVNPTSGGFAAYMVLDNMASTFTGITNVATTSFIMQSGSQFNIQVVQTTNIIAVTYNLSLIGVY